MIPWTDSAHNQGRDIEHIDITKPGVTVDAWIGLMWGLGLMATTGIAVMLLWVWLWRNWPGMWS